MNSITLVGNLTKDIELRKTDKDMSIATFTVAVRRDYKNSNGEYETDFINCKAFRTTADYLEKYSSKGNMVVVSGALHTGSYDKQDGTKGYISEVVVEKARILNAKKQENNEEDALADFADNWQTLDNDELPLIKKGNYEI